MFSDDEDLSIFESVLENPLILDQDKLMDDLLAESAPLESSEVIPKKRRNSSAQENMNNHDGGSASRKTAHRDTERQRRQEMAGLYASLRSLLPLEYVTGKRAISDHMQEAVKYIKDMQKKIDEMKIRREKLKNKFGNANSNVDYSQYFVKVNLHRAQMEILMESSLNEESFPLSKVLAELSERGLNVITCVSTRGHQCHLHKLQIELQGTTSIDVSELQDRLLNLIKLA